MLKHFARWYVSTFGPINQIQSYMYDNWDNPVDYHKIPGLETRRWMPDIKTNKTLEIIHTRQVRGDLIEVFLRRKLIVSYVDQTDAYSGLPFLGISDIHISENFHKTEKYYLYSHICECFKAK